MGLYEKFDQENPLLGSLLPKPRKAPAHKTSGSSVSSKHSHHRLKSPINRIIENKNGGMPRLFHLPTAHYRGSGSSPSTQTQSSIHESLFNSDRTYITPSTSLSNYNSQASISLATDPNIGVNRSFLSSSFYDNIPPIPQAVHRRASYSVSSPTLLLTPPLLSASNEPISDEFTEFNFEGFDDVHIQSPSYIPSKEHGQSQDTLQENIAIEKSQANFTKVAADSNPQVINGSNIDRDILSQENNLHFQPKSIPPYFATSNLAINENWTPKPAVQRFASVSSSYIATRNFTPSAPDSVGASIPQKSRLKVCKVRTVQTQDTSLTQNNNFYTGEKGLIIDTSVQDISKSELEENESIWQAHEEIFSPTDHTADLNKIPRKSSDLAYSTLTPFNNLSSTLAVIASKSPLSNLKISPLKDTSDPIICSNGSIPLHASLMQNINDQEHNGIQQTEDIAESTFVSDYEDYEDDRASCQRTHPFFRDQRSLFSIESNILDASGGVKVPSLFEADYYKYGIQSNTDIDINSESQVAKEKKGCKKRTQSTSSCLTNANSINILQSQTSKSQMLSTYFPKSQFLNSHMPPPIVIDEESGQPRLSYPAPIPIELKLPPLLSKKNLKKAKVGHPISQGPKSSIDFALGTRAFPTPPVWHADNRLLYPDIHLIPKSEHEDYTDNYSRATPQIISKELDEPIYLVKFLDNTKDSANYKIPDYKMSITERLGTEICIRCTPETKISGTEVSGNGTSESSEENQKDNAILYEQNADYRSIISSFSSKPRYDRLKDESWGVQPTLTELQYAGQMVDSDSNFINYCSDEELVRSDCATIRSDELYQDDILAYVESTEELVNADKSSQIEMRKSSNIDDFAFTYFDPNTAITDRGLLAGSLSYSSGMVPAVGIQALSLIQELEMRKKGWQSRLQQVYYDSQGYAIAAETDGRGGPKPDRLLRDPNSGHPLDGRQNKSLLQLQNDALEAYESQKQWRHRIHAVAETSRMARMGILSNETMLDSHLPVSTIYEDNVNETLGERRERLKLRRKEAAGVAAKAIPLEAHNSNETLAQRRDRLKKHKGLLKKESIIKKLNIDFSLETSEEEMKRSHIYKYQPSALKIVI